MKAQIVGELAREGDKVVGTIRFIDDTGNMIGDFSLCEELSTIVNMRDAEQLEEYLINTSMAGLRAAKLESDWLKIQALAFSLQVKAEEATNLSGE